MAKSASTTTSRSPAISASMIALPEQSDEVVGIPCARAANRPASRRSEAGDDQGDVVAGAACDAEVGQDGVGQVLRGAGGAAGEGVG